MAYKIVVGSSDGVNINLKFGEVTDFIIYEVEGVEYHLYERRHAGDEVVMEDKENSGCGASGGCGEIGNGCGGSGGGCGGPGDVIHKVALIDDCRCVVCKKIGFQAQKQFEKKAISVFDVACEVTEALDKIVSYYHQLDRRKLVSKRYHIRKATLRDIDQITALEALCFPAKEAATKEDFLKRLTVYADHFLVAEEDGNIISIVNGMVSNEENLRDEMYENAGLHDEEGDWQMIFGVLTHPNHRRKGIAAKLLTQFINEARKEQRKGLVLTCKEELLHYYEKFGFVSEGISASEHGGVVWYQMRLVYEGAIHIIQGDATGESYD